MNIYMIANEKMSDEELNYINNKFNITDFDIIIRFNNANEILELIKN